MTAQSLCKESELAAEEMWLADTDSELGAEVSSGSGSDCDSPRPRGLSDPSGHKTDLSSAWTWRERNTFVEVSDDPDLWLPVMQRSMSEPELRAGKQHRLREESPRGMRKFNSVTGSHGIFREQPSSLKASAPEPAARGGSIWAAGKAMAHLSFEVESTVDSTPPCHSRVSAADDEEEAPLDDFGKGAEPICDADLSSAWTWHERNTFVEVSDDVEGPSPPMRRSMSDPVLQLPQEEEEEQRRSSWSDNTTKPSSAVTRSRGVSASTVVPPPPAPYSGPDGERPAARLAGMQTDLPSAGSLGHPFICTLMCKHVVGTSFQNCPNGDSCGFCHVPECRSRRMQLDKKNRKTFGRMTVHRKIEVILPVLRAKVRELGLGDKAAEAVETWWTSAVSKLPLKDGPTVREPGEARLVSFLECMKITDLCLLPGPLDGPLKEASTRLLDELRDVASIFRQPCSC